MKRRRVCRFEWLTLLPDIGPFPQTSQRWDMVWWLSWKAAQCREHWYRVLELRPPQTWTWRAPGIHRAVAEDNTWPRRGLWDPT
jgi:hypothetical protein